MKRKSISVLKTTFVLSVFWLPHIATANSADQSVVVKTAPIVLHGHLSGSPLDVTLSYFNLDLAVPTIEKKDAGPARVSLPKDIINLGAR